MHELIAEQVININAVGIVICWVGILALGLAVAVMGR